MEDEARQGLQSLPYMMGLDRLGTRMKGEIAFIDYVVAPLWKPLARMLPELKVCLQDLEQNRAVFKRIGEEWEIEEKRRKSTLTAAVAAAGVSVDEEAG